MAKKDKEDFVVEEAVPVMEAQAPEVPFTPVVEEPIFSFQQWCSLRKKKATHVGGLRSFCKNIHIPRTLSAWDKVFKDY